MKALEKLLKQYRDREKIGINADDLEAAIAADRAELEGLVEDAGAILEEVESQMSNHAHSRIDAIIDTLTDYLKGGQDD